MLLGRVRAPAEIAAGANDPARQPEPIAVAPTVVTPGAPVENARVIVRATPLSARITVDAQGPAVSPWAGFLAKDGATHTVRVDADGYAPHEESFQVAGDTTLLIALEPRKAAARAASTARPAAPPALAAASAVQVPPPPPGSATARPDAPPAQILPGSVPLRRINQANPYAH
jgi:hypothetical protein